MATVTSLKAGDFSDAAGNVWDGDHHVPIANDAVVLAHAITWDAAQGARIPVTSGTLTSITGSGANGQFIIPLNALAASCLLDVAAITPGTITATGFVEITGDTTGKALTISNSGGNVTCSTPASSTQKVIRNGGTGTGTVTVLATGTAGAGTSRTIVDNGSTGILNVSGSFTGGGSVSSAAGVINTSTGTINVSNATLTGGSGANLGNAGLSNRAGGIVNFNNVNIVNSATANGYEGPPPATWVMTTRQNYIQYPAINLEGAGNAVVKMAVALAPGLVKENQLGYYSDGTLLGTRVDCPVGKAVTSSGNYGDPGSPLAGLEVMPDDTDVRVDVPFGDCSGSPEFLGRLHLPHTSENSGDVVHADLVLDTATFGVDSATEGTAAGGGGAALSRVRLGM